MSNVSPGVFTKIIDLSTFVQAVPSTIGLVCGLTEKGRDNELIFVGSRSDFISEWGSPDIKDFGKLYGQGPYIAYNFLGESGALYWMRCLPQDAAFANIKLNASFGPSDSSASIVVTYVDAVNSKIELKSNLEATGTTYPLAIIYPIGRGQYYNQIAIRLTEYSNPTVFGVYVLDVYEKQTDGQDVIIESFNVSFEPTATDSAGDSMFIAYVLSTYSTVVRCEMVLPNEEYSEGYKKAVKVYDKNMGYITIDLTNGSASVMDNKQDFTDWKTNPETGNANYSIIAKDSRGNTIWGWLGDVVGSDETMIGIFPERNLTGATRGWNGDVVNFDLTMDVNYYIQMSVSNIAAPFITAEPMPLRKGSDGSLRSSTGGVVSQQAELLLEQAYSGLLDDTILDTENVYFTLVFDAGYPTDVKTAISILCQTRRDCVAITDNGDNSTVNSALSTRSNIHPYNSFYLAIYECFSKVSDPFTGEDIWFSPMYHMSYLLPRNDNVGELWFAAAGFTRGAIDSIKELRFNPRLGQRDQMYLKQLNPIVKFSNGYVVWGQLTSQAKPSALQDLNIVRLVLYCKRALEQYCRFFIFEQNDPITWRQVATNITGFLETIKVRRGLDSYAVEVGASDYERKTKKFHVNVRLQPTRTVEQIELNFFIE